MSRDIEQGTIKVAWLEEKAESMSSRMFNTVEEAEQFAEENNKKDYLIFKLLEQKDMEEFKWELLPYGRFGLFKKLFRIYKNGLLSKLMH